MLCIINIAFNTNASMHVHVLWMKLAQVSPRQSAWCRTRKMHEAVHVNYAWGRPPTCMRPYKCAAWGCTRTLHEAVHEPWIRIFLIFFYLNSIWNLRQYVFECILYEKSSHYAFTIISKGNKLSSLWDENAINVHELFPVYGYTQC